MCARRHKPRGLPVARLGYSFERYLVYAIFGLAGANPRFTATYLDLANGGTALGQPDGVELRLLGQDVTLALPAVGTCQADRLRNTRSVIGREHRRDPQGDREVEAGKDPRDPPDALDQLPDGGHEPQATSTAWTARAKASSPRVLSADNRRKTSPTWRSGSWLGKLESWRFMAASYAGRRTIPVRPRGTRGREARRCLRAADGRPV